MRVDKRKQGLRVIPTILFHEYRELLPTMQRADTKLPAPPSRPLYFFSVDNICIELSLYAVAVRFLDYRFFLF